MNLFKTLPPLTKIRFLCALNILISIVSLILYVWIDPIFANKIDSLILAFTIIFLVPIPFFFVRTVLIKSGFYETQPGVLITKEGEVYGRESLFLKFPLPLLLVALVWSQFSLTINLEQSFIWGLIAAIVAINTHNLIHLPWVYKNFPHLELPKNNTKA